MRSRPAIAIMLLLALAAPAAAEEVVTYDARGRGDDSAADPRTAALDAAFAVAVTEAVADLAGAAARAKATDVDREIIKRARRFVASFQVRSQSVVPGGTELDVAVRVDLDKVRARLTELGVAVRAVPQQPEPTPAVRGKKTATVLLRVVGASRTSATFGSAATDDVPGLARLVETLIAAGYTVVPASAAGPPVGDDGDLPVDDTGARALGGDARADVAVIAGVTVGEVGIVRGVALRAAPAVARLRVLDVRTGNVLDETVVQSGAWGQDERLPRVAAESAIAAAASAAWAPKRGPTPGGTAPAVTASHGVTVRIRGEQPWAAATAIRTRLAAAAGVGKVTWAGLGGDQIVLGVTGLTAAKVAGAIRTAEGLSARVDVDGDVVEVRP